MFQQTFKYLPVNSNKYFVLWFSKYQSSWARGELIREPWGGRAVSGNTTEREQKIKGNKIKQRDKESPREIVTQLWFISDIYLHLTCPIPRLTIWHIFSDTNTRGIIQALTSYFFYFLTTVRVGSRYQSGWFFGKVPKAGRGVIFNPKNYMADFGTLNRAFLAWNWHKSVISGFNSCF